PLNAIRDERTVRIKLTAVFFFQAEDGIRDRNVTGVQTCALPIWVLVLSEFAGAADELGQALLVNPHDIEGLKSAMMRAATMEPPERRRRMRALRKRVLSGDVQSWARKFLTALANDHNPHE